MATNLRSRTAWNVLTAVLAIELVGGAAFVIGMFPTFPAAGPERDELAPLWLSLFVSLMLCCVWVAATFVGAFRRRGSWVRGAAVTIHVLMFAAAIAVFQGVLGTPTVGAVLLGLAVIGFAAAITIRTPDHPAMAPTDADEEIDGPPRPAKR